VVAQPKSPRPVGGIAPRPDAAAAAYPSNRPPVRPEYAVAPNSAYGNTTMDPAFAYAPPPPPAAANYNYPAPAPGQPAVFTPAPVVYTPQYGRM
jgi:hypothetical protein